MSETYTRINWKDGENGGTPISADNLNLMDLGIEKAHQLIEELKENGVGGVTEEQLKNAVDAYFIKNPIQTVSDIFMRVSDGYIQFSTDNLTWKNVIAVSELKGQTGKTAYEYAKDGGYTGTEEEFAQKLAKEIKVDSELSEESENPVQNKVVAQKFSQLSDTVNNQREDIANKELSGTAETKVAEHNVSEESHSDIRLLIDNLSELVTSLLDSDDETLNQTSEIVAYVKSNKSLIDSITTSKVNVSDIIDNLTTSVSNKPLSAKQGVVLKGLIDTLQAELNKITIPTTLPNPHKLIFQGAVTAEYDGSGAVTVTIPSGGNGGSVTERIEKLSTDAEVELQPNKLYIFPEMPTLTYTLAEISDNSVLNEYHFVFQSGATVTEVVHPESVNIGSFAVEANKIYEISIMEGLLTSQSWAVSL